MTIPTRTALALPFLLAAPELAGAQVLSVESYGSGCAAPNNFSQIGRPSADGRWVLFSSFGSNLVPNDPNGTGDVFLRDRWTRTTICVSVDPNGDPGNAGSHLWKTVSPDGRWVAFESAATNLVAGDTNGQPDVFVRDLALGTTVRVNLATGGAQANAGGTHASISDDGRFVVFASVASNLVAGDFGVEPDIFLHDRDPDADGIFDQGNGTTVCVSTDHATGLPANASSFQPSIAGDGSVVAYESAASGIVAGDLNGTSDVFLWTRASGTTAIVSLSTTGAQANGASGAVWLSSDGLHASFASLATNLVPGGDGNSTWDVYVRDLASGTTELASPGTDAQGTYGSSISGDGRFVALVTGAKLVPEDQDGDLDVYLRDRQNGTTTLLSTGTSPFGTPHHFDAAITADGGFVSWVTQAVLLPGDVNSSADVYLLDLGSVQPAQTSFCSGDGSSGPCPCGNAGQPGTGCAHSQGAAARLAAYGTTVPERVVLAVHGELSDALTVFLQGSATVPASPFGDGLRCIGGELLRLNVTNASNGDAYYPACPFPASILARSAELGDPIAPGATRYYMTYFRDPSAVFCPAGGTFNASNAIALTW